jgi:integrase
MALRAWIGTLKCKLKSIRNVLQPLSNVLTQAEHDGIIESNPLERIKLKKLIPPKQRKSDFVTDPFNMGEIVAILANTDGQEKNLFQFAFASGLRTSECMALEWGCIDWINNTISVEKVKVVGITKDEAKTEAGLRKIDMRQGAWDALKAQEQFTGLAGGVIFHDPGHNEPWATHRAIRRRWKITLRKAKVRYRNPYQTRHTYASTLLSSGENQLYVAKQMGHKDTEMLNRHYARWIEQGSDEKTRKAAAAFFAKVSPKSETE